MAKAHIVGAILDNLWIICWFEI